MTCFFGRAFDVACGGARLVGGFKYFLFLTPTWEIYNPI